MINLDSKLSFGTVFNSSTPNLNTFHFRLVKSTAFANGVSIPALFYFRVSDFVV